MSSTPEGTNAALEFHDSEVGSVTTIGHELSVVFSAAYVHRSAGRPGLDAGKGYIAPLTMKFREATSEGNLPLCFGQLSTGNVECGGVKMDLIPLPYSSDGPIVGYLQFTNGAVLIVHASQMQCTITGEETFVESYAC